MLKLLVVTAAAIGTMAAADLSGRWTGTMETNGNRVNIFLTLNFFQPSTGGQQHTPVVSGTVATGERMKPVEIANVEPHQDGLAFEVRDNANRLVKFRLTLNGGSLTGEANADGQISKVSLSRAAGLGQGGGDRAGVGAGVYRVGGGVSAPMLIRKVEPQYTEEARAAKYQGTVLLSVEIDPNGSATNIRVQRSLGLGLDQEAIEAVKQWKFKPGLKDGSPVTVAATIEVNFRL